MQAPWRGDHADDTAGGSAPLGATPSPRGVNFSIFSRHATGIDLLFFGRADDNEPETRAALDLIFSNHFSRYEPDVFEPLRETLLTRGDHYMHLADLGAYLEADRRLLELYADPDGWAGKVILNVVHSGTFSSDRTIDEYAREIWGAKPCPVP